MSPSRRDSRSPDTFDLVRSQQETLHKLPGYFRRDARKCGIFCVEDLQAAFFCVTEQQAKCSCPTTRFNDPTLCPPDEATLKPDQQIAD
jgi:hypothetical protein